MKTVKEGGDYRYGPIPVYGPNNERACQMWHFSLLVDRGITAGGRKTGSKKKSDRTINKGGFSDEKESSYNPYRFGDFVDWPGVRTIRYDNN
jgi:hypothetical protein